MRKAHGDGNAAALSKALASPLGPKPAAIAAAEPEQDKEIENSIQSRGRLGRSGKSGWVTSNAARALARKQAREARAAQRNGKKRKRKWSKQPPSPADTGRPGRQKHLAERVEISPGVAVAAVGVQTDFVFYLLADAPGDEAYEDSESSSNTGDVCLTPISEPEGRPYSI